MIEFPDRLSALAALLEAGQPVNLAVLAKLQALDVARIGQRFAQEAMQRDAQQTEEMRRIMEGQ